MELPGLVELILPYRQGDPAASERLLGIALEMADRIKGDKFSHLGDGDALDAVLHLMEKLRGPQFKPDQCRDDSAAGAWFRTVITNFLSSRARRRIRPILATDDEAKRAAEGDDAPFDPAARSTTHDAGPTEELLALGARLRRIHHEAEIRLDAFSRGVDFAAVYLWRFRTLVYMALRRAYLRARDWHSCVLEIEERWPWEERQQRRKFRDHWPAIGALWSDLRPAALEKDSLDARTIISTAKTLSPQLNASPDTLYQWFCRLRQHLQRIATEPDFVEAIDDRRMIDWWINLMIGQGET